MRTLPETTASLSALLRPEKVHFWGQDYEVTPVLVPEVLGDGAQIIGFSPLNTRPNYYVVRVDSTWSTGNWDDEPLLIDHIECIYQAIEGYFGTAYYECDCACADCGDGCSCDCDCPGHEANGWPALNDEVGSSWFWLAGAHPELRQRAA